MTEEETSPSFAISSSGGKDGEEYEYNDEEVAETIRQMKPHLFDDSEDSDDDGVDSEEAEAETDFREE